MEMAQARYYIALDLSRSTSANHPLTKRIYASDIRDFGEHRYYGIEKLPNNECLLDPKHRPKNMLDITPEIMFLSRIFGCFASFVKRPEKQIPLSNIDYIFVIVEGNDLKPLLKINQGGSHYLLAGKADRVLAAGTIRFKNKQIVSFDDESGCYQIDLLEKPKEEREQYKTALMQVFREVGLPTELFNLKYFIAADKADNSESFDLFNMPKEITVYKSQFKREIKPKQTINHLSCYLFFGASALLAASSAGLALYFRKI